MLERLKARKAEITRLREERGATDPILIIAGIAITLILLVGGSFAISGFIANANDLNAKGDLDRIATAQAAFLATNDRYGNLSVGPDVATQNTELADAAIGFTPTAGNNVKVRTSPSGWTAVTKSASGDVFLRSSSSSTIFKLGADSSNPQYGEPAEATRNLFPNSNATLGSSFGGWAGNAGNVYERSVVAAPWAPSGSAVRATWTAVASSGSGNTGPLISAAPVGERYTIAYDVRVSGATNMSQMGFSGTVGDSTLVASSNSSAWSLAAGTTVRVWTTFVRDAASGSDARIVTTPSSKTPGWFMDISSIDLYPGDYDPSRDFFSGSTPATADAVYSWAGTVNNSASIKSVRPIIANQPAGFTLPAGITWQQVGADAAEVQ
jgi:hypothetical protein